MARSTRAMLRRSSSICPWRASAPLQALKVEPDGGQSLADDIVQIPGDPAVVPVLVLQRGYESLGRRGRTSFADAVASTTSSITSRRSARSTRLRMAARAITLPRCDGSDAYRHPLVPPPYVGDRSRCRVWAVDPSAMGGVPPAARRIGTRDPNLRLCCRVAHLSMPSRVRSIASCRSADTYSETTNRTVRGMTIRTDRSTMEDVRTADSSRFVGLLPPPEPAPGRSVIAVAVAAFGQLWDPDVLFHRDLGDPDDRGFPLRVARDGGPDRDRDAACSCCTSISGPWQARTGRTRGARPGGMAADGRDRSDHRRHGGSGRDDEPSLRGALPPHQRAAVDRSRGRAQTARVATCTMVSGKP